MRVYDPEGRKEGAGLLPGVDWQDDVYAALDGAEAAVILTEWNEFRALDLPRMKKLMKRAVLVDLRNIYRADEVVAAGFAYHSIGRKPATGD